jgi:hypothetical protein
VLSRHIPAELIFLKQRRGMVKEVVSALSTSLYTARIILGEDVEIKVVDGSALSELFRTEVGIKKI